MRKKRLVISMVVVIVLVSCLLLLARPAKPMPNVHVRIVSVSTNAPGFLDWNVAVTKVTDRSVDWFVTMQATNRGSVLANSSVRLLESVNLPHSFYRMGEEGHIAGPTLWDTSQVYRAVGLVCERSKLIEMMASVAGTNRTFLKVFRIIPEPKPTFATSEWVELRIPE
jgi:hypothetical protein